MGYEVHKRARVGDPEAGAIEPEPPELGHLAAGSKSWPTQEQRHNFTRGREDRPVLWPVCVRRQQPRGTQARERQWRQDALYTRGLRGLEHGGSRNVRGFRFVPRGLQLQQKTRV